jgi:hypothetical protein
MLGQIMALIGWAIMGSSAPNGTIPLLMLLLLNCQLLLKNGMQRGQLGGADVVGLTRLKPFLAIPIASGEIFESVQDSLGILLLFLFTDLTLLQQKFPTENSSFMICGILMNI